jgi:hypothetical protein
MEKAVLDKLLMLIDDLDTKGGVFTNATLSNTELLQMQDAIRQVKKPLRRRFVDTLKKILLWLRYHLYYSWRHRLKR